MIRLALMPHPEKEGALNLTAQLIDKLSNEDAVLWLEPTAAAKLGRDDLAGRIEMLKTCDVALVLGGDGALLKAARLVAPWHVPVLGVNFGHLGFLMATEPDGVDRALDRLFAGDFHIEERLMLVATADDGEGDDKDEVRTGGPSVGERPPSGPRPGSFIGLNDAVVARGPFARVLEFEIDVDGTPAGSFLADGVIVSTPTGSTGYSLSAGGPIVHPQVEALIVTPICPHTVGVRGFVARPDEEVAIRVVSPDGEAMLTVDGQSGQPLKNGSRVTVRRAKDRARFVSFGDRSFYSLLRQRLRQGNG